jgi:protein-disulfide isomerase
LQTLGGAEATLSSHLSGRTVVLFWNPSCGFCERMLPDLQRFEAGPAADTPSLLLISSGDAATNREMGLRAPILLDQSFAAGNAFGVSGTPSAVVVDEQGLIASPVAVGAQAALALLGAGARLQAA